mgnify:CR=1 FL=1
MTTTLKAIVRKPRTDGLYVVCIRIVHNRKPGYIKTNKIVDADHISKENEPTLSLMSIAQCSFDNTQTD